MDELVAGMPAPDFDLVDQSGNKVKLSRFRGASPVVLFFYPKDHTRICTQEACGFRDAYERFRAAGAAVLGISSDSTDSHQSFAKEYNLPYPLLADEGGRVRQRYGVKKTLGLLPGRTTFIIDRNGVIRHVYGSALDANAHVTEALDAITTLLL
jgi:peroxiredoxin Q/BCP